MGICQCSHFLDKDVKNIVNIDIHEKKTINQSNNNSNNTSNKNSNLSNSKEQQQVVPLDNNTYQPFPKPLDSTLESTLPAANVPYQKQGLSKFKHANQNEFTQSLHGSEDSSLKYEQNPNTVNNNIITNSMFSRAQKKGVLEARDTLSSIQPCDVHLALGDKEIITVLILGGPAVGKSSLLIKIIQNKFEKHYIPTIGVEQKKKILRFKGRVVEINYIVTPGENTYKEDYKVIYKKLKAIFLMYDITSIETFTESMRLYEKEVKQHFEQLNMNIPLVYFIGNKIDLRERKVSFELPKQFCEKYNLMYYEVSVKTGANVRILLKDLLDKCVVFNEGIEE